MSEPATNPVADFEILCSWDGPARHAPGVLFEESTGEGMLGGDVVLLEFAAWVALAAVSGVIGNSSYEAIKAKVLGVLTAWRRRKGQARLDEVKEQVFEELKKHRANGKLTEGEVKTRLDAFFAEVQG
jgi:hypothetical protein